MAQHSTIGNAPNLSSLKDTLVNPLNSLNLGPTTFEGGGDAHFFEESIHPSAVKTYLSSSNNTGSSSTLSISATASLLKGMKWLLAMMSKGRDVSSFFSDVVKLVSCPNMEIKKMTYMYLVEYADYSPQCRELALLSINSFQRGLADAEQLIRALALRVLTCIQIKDIFQIQVLAVRKCIQDSSPLYESVNAIAKLHHFCRSGGASGEGTSTQQKELLQLLENLLNNEVSTMVLSSAMTTFVEICPNELALLHRSYRKLCHLLTDMDEWGQIVTMDVLLRYCRVNFINPGDGSAEKIDAARRRLRQQPGAESKTVQAEKPSESMPTTLSMTANTAPVAKARKKRVVRKGFYSDDEDESEYEDDYTFVEDCPQPTLTVLGSNGTNNTDEEAHLDEDHRLLLSSSLPLLKSRNSGVVLGVCSLHYYCGVSSVRVRAALGKALVRIHRDNREIQFVVLKTIRFLAIQCPSAFTPYINDFFVKAMDPSFTRLIKLDILTSLALETDSIAAVLREFRSYIRHDDIEFVCASIRAIGRISESQINKVSNSNDSDQSMMTDASTTVLNCLYGLLNLASWSKDASIVGECIVVICSLAQLSHFSLQNASAALSDPNNTKSMAMRRLLLLLVRSLAPNELKPNEEENFDDDVDDEDERTKRGDVLPSSAIAASLWIVGEWATIEISQLPQIDFELQSDARKVRMEILRLLARSFVDFEPIVKLQGLHLVSKVLVAEKERNQSDDLSRKTCGICEHIMSLGQLDVVADVRDRARFEGLLLQNAIGIGGDGTMFNASEVGDLIGTGTNDAKSVGASSQALSVATAKAALAKGKPIPNSLPFDVKEEEISRFGSLSSLVSHHAGSSYLSLPPWADRVSSSSLRDPVARGNDAELMESPVNGHKMLANGNSFYDDEESSSSFSSDDSSNDSSSSGDDDVSSSSSSSSSSSEAGSEESSINDFSDIDGSSSSEESEYDSSDDDSYAFDSKPTLSGQSAAQEGNLINVAGPQPSTHVNVMPTNAPRSTSTNASNAQPSTFANDLAGLVMAPAPVREGHLDEPADFERDCSCWYQLLRPELAGGLFVSYRYIRGASLNQELNVLGLSMKASTLCLQVKFVNKRSDGVVLRHVRILQRGGTGVRRVVLPEEIAALGKQQGALATVGIDFGDSLTVSSGCSVRFDIKTGAETYQSEIKPPLAEVLRRSETSPVDFDRAVSRLTGFQRSKSALIPAGPFKDIPKLICQHVNLTKLKSSPERHLLAARLPGSSTEVYVAVTPTDICLYSENALVLSSLLGVIKSAICA
eukprot:CAMPEP_0116009626 /NCGR_PEP_ID=MMETSP0321-20121206/3537_1 /TAXON_ID=163516 /ORGANISM="Leptocylindrus danicus var. danicus, Strain B650" /LENGTH=1287 /DNA_ID=CAMNT_0003478609 /DNA_START=266 /DNA_END=4130 /DNA_ORIENTATION=+